MNRLGRILITLGAAVLFVEWLVSGRRRWR